MKDIVYIRSYNVNILYQNFELKKVVGPTHKVGLCITLQAGVSNEERW